MDKISLVVLEKMDPHYSFGGLNSQQSISCKLQLVVFKEGTNLLQHAQIIYMHDNDNPFIK
jgi:hypothetical protein